MSIRLLQLGLMVGWMGASLSLPRPAAAQEPSQQVDNLSPGDLFVLAARATEAGNLDDALALYDALSRNPEIEVRTEARFRKAQLLVSLGRIADAAKEYRAILDEKPDATRVRLELARVLAMLGDESGALRAVRQAQAQELPSDIAALIEQYAAALRSSRPFGGSIEFGFAPDSNINRATTARMLDTVIAPLTLSDDARERSGIGLLAAAQGFARIPLASNLSLLPRAVGRGMFYQERAFNDSSVSALVGAEWRLGQDRLTPSVGRTWRWYGPSLYATTDTATLSWVRPLGRRMQSIVSASAARADYKANPLQTGGLYDLSATFEYALDPRTGIGGTLSGTRQDAADPGYATSSGALGVYGWQEFGRTTLLASASLRRTVGDERLFLFPERRKEWLLQASVGATFRQLSWQGFAPLVRLGFEDNNSTIALYRYRRVNAEFGLTRAF